MLESLTVSGRREIVMRTAIATACSKNLTRPEDTRLHADLNGNYFSDACAAQVGGLGMRRCEHRVTPRLEGSWHRPKYSGRISEPVGVLGRDELDTGWMRPPSVESLSRRRSPAKAPTFARLLPGVRRSRFRFAPAIWESGGGRPPISSFRERIVGLEAETRRRPRRIGTPLGGNDPRRARIRAGLAARERVRLPGSDRARLPAREGGLSNRRAAFVEPRSRSLQGDGGKGAISCRRRRSHPDRASLAVLSSGPIVSLGAVRRRSASAERGGNSWTLREGPVGTDAFPRRIQLTRSADRLPASLVSPPSARDSSDDRS